jgi:hypothetical protein
MGKKPAGVKLISREGYHCEWVDPELRPVGTGFGLAVPCQFGGVPLVHWLAPDPSTPDRYAFTNAPHAWPMAREAFAAMDAYRAQESA